MINYTIRVMTPEDYHKVHQLWMKIHGFGIRSIDDSEEGVLRFLDRNPNTSMVALVDNSIVGTILCGHDGRQGSFYHVCVQEEYRKQGIGKAMATACMRALQAEHINKLCLVAFTDNKVGNQFWNEEGWHLRPDLNYYDFPLNDENIVRFNQ